jgi:hypothetical protein
VRLIGVFPGKAVTAGAGLDKKFLFLLTGNESSFIMCAGTVERAQMLRLLDEL